MGICISYGGRLTDLSRIDEFTDELEDVCKSMEWDHDVLRDSWTDPVTLRWDDDSDDRLAMTGNSGLRGVQIVPHPRSEVFHFTINREGFLNYRHGILFKMPMHDTLNTPFLFAKTQFAGAEVHMQMIKLMRHLKTKYLHDLWVQDEAEYWDTGDEEVVASRIGFLNDAIGLFRDELERGRSIDDILKKWHK